MRIAVVSDWFSERMGYAENALPKALAALGHDVHVITTNAQVYFDSGFYADTYEPFLGPPLVACEVKHIDGYTLHRTPYGRSTGWPWSGTLSIPALFATLRTLKPDIAQTFDVACPSTHDAAVGRYRLGYRLFLESHVHASVWSGNGQGGVRGALGRMLDGAWLMGRFASLAAAKCYPISADAADIAIRHFGMQASKVAVTSLGVDHTLFRPIGSESERQSRSAMRREFGFSTDDIVCIYTGRLTTDKGPYLLAQAVDALARQGECVKGLFVGQGPRAVVDTIRGCRGCVVRPFVPVDELPPYYRAADVGVWPRQESTSQLDAIACGLPIVISNRVTVRERADTTGLFYEEGDVDDLARQIVTLKDASLRQRLGREGPPKVAEHYSWLSIAARRVADYAAALDPA